MKGEFENKSSESLNDSYYDDLRKKYSSDGGEYSLENQTADIQPQRAAKKKFVIKIEEETVETPKNKNQGDYKAKLRTAADFAQKSFKNGKNTLKQSNQSFGYGLRTIFQKAAARLKISLTAVIVIFVSCVLIVSSLFSAYLLSCANDILAIKSSTDIVTVTIPENASTITAVKVLKDNGLIKHRVFCTAFAIVSGFGKTDYLNGIYYINGKMGLEGMLSQFKDKPKTAKTVQLTFPEGWTVQQIIDRLDEAEVCDKAILYKTLDEVSFDYDFLKAVPDTMGRYSKYEGYLYPDTYDFYIGENANSVFKRFFDNFEKKMLDTYKDRAAELGVSIDDIVKIASIIQKEAKDATQMAGISSVLHNRLYKFRADFPNLAFDSTVYYCRDYVIPNVNPNDKDIYLDKYNTYICEGLPAGAICNPGIDAIYAALYPADSSNCYFLHGMDGEIHYAKTNAQHEQNKLKYLYSKPNANTNN